MTLLHYIRGYRFHPTCALSCGFRRWVVLLCLAAPLPVFGGEASNEVRELLLETRSLSSTETESVLQHAAEALAAGMPRSLLLGRVREGLVKQATAAQLIEAIESSRQAHQDAVALLRGGPQGRRRGQRQPEMESLHDILVRAIESGLPRRAFEELFAGGAMPRGLGDQRMQAIVEAGEMLHLAGMDSDMVRRFMLTCRDRQVRRMEALRAARQAVFLHRQGMKPDAIWRQVWNIRD